MTSGFYDRQVLAEISRHAEECTVLSHARALTAWVGEGKPVTAKGVLRPGDARTAASALGITVPAHIRSAADVEAIHHPWLVAEAAGVLAVNASRATAAPTADGDPLALWLAGLEAVLRAESHDQPRRQGAMVLCRTLLTVLATDPPPAVDQLPDTAYQLLDFLDPRDARAVFEAFRCSMMPVDAALVVLAEFGAVDGETRLTPLGRWAQQELQARVPAPITPELSAHEVLGRLARLPDDEPWRQLQRWLAGRPVAEAAEQLLRAADAASPAERVTAADLVADLGEPALPAWRQALQLRNLATHAQWMLATWDETADISDAQRCWLVTEYALAALATRDAEDAYHYVQEHGGMDTVDCGGHPDASTLRDALTRFVASGAGRVHIYQLKIELRRVRPPVWRKVLVPAGASLATLHEIIRAVFGWSGDHLHQFTVGGARYSDPFYGLEECVDQHVARLSKVLPRPGTRISYVYDFGDWWEHQITLERVLHPDDTVTYPTCVAGRGDAPIEDWKSEFPTDSAPFDQADINRRLATLTRIVAR